MISRAIIFDKLTPWLLFISNLLVALGAELAHDEAYYWLFSKNLAWGYFDHPPMVAWIIAATQWLGGEVGVRLGFILLMQFSAWLLTTLCPKENRSLIWLGCNIFPLLAYAGCLAIPDGPLVFFTIFWLWQLDKSLKDDSILNALKLSVLTALLFYSKYHGVFTVIATIIALPRLLKRPTFWLSAFVGLVFFFPHVWWQWSHGFSTFKYHFLERPAVEPGFSQPLQYLGLQLGLPGLFLAPFMWREFIRRKSASEFDRVLAFIFIITTVFFFLSTFNKKLEANWTVATGIPFLLFVARGSFYIRYKSRIQVWGGVSLVIILISKVLLVVPAEWHGIRRGHEIHGWQNWANKISEDTQDCHLAANNYQIASKLSFYLKRDIPALNIKSRLNQFEYWDWDKKWKPDDQICWITQHKKHSSHFVNGPDGKKLVLVKGKTVGDILSLKTREL